MSAVVTEETPGCTVTFDKPLASGSLTRSKWHVQTPGYHATLTSVSADGYTVSGTGAFYVSGGGAVQVVYDGGDAAFHGTNGLAVAAFTKAATLG